MLAAAPELAATDVACGADDLVGAAEADAATEEDFSLVRLLWIFSCDARRKRHW
jgi:hypothetical protein